MSRLIILGSGTPDFTPQRWGTSFLFEVDGEWLMVDCGPASTYKMFQAGISPTQVDHLFLTHFHSDHIADYPCFLMTRFDQSIGQEAILNVYGPSPIGAMTDKIWSPQGAFWPDAIARVEHPMSQAVYHGRGGQGQRPYPAINTFTLEAGATIIGNRWKCDVYEIQHAQPYLTCFGFRFETNNGIIVFSGDAEPNGSLKQLAQGADLLVMAAMGFSDSKYRRRGAEIAKDAGVKQLVITHQAPNVAADSEAVFEDIQKIYDGPVHWGQDLMEVVW